ncbi:MAG: alkaline phosphatase family protein [Dehalococcoidia bacterium]|nr:alkaline phosphatase family protein [Dehalococcoidia bacterium]
MSDVEELLACFEDGTLLRPTAKSPNIVDLARAMGSLLGARDDSPTAGSVELVGLIGSADHFIFILADGLGLDLVEGLPYGAFLQKRLKAALQTVFPSSTSVVLTTMATGEWPNRHAVTGQWTHLPEIRAAAALLPFTVRSGGRSLAKMGYTVEQAFPLPSNLSNLSRDVLAVLPSQMVKSVSSAYFAGYKARIGYRTLAEAVDIISARVKSAQAPTYTYLYTPLVDLEAHWHGVAHPAVRGVILYLNRQIERLAASVSDRARIVLTADHGLLDAPIEAKRWIKPSAELFESLLFPPSGDSRVMFLHQREGAGEQLCQRFRKRFGDTFFLISTDEAEQVELLGPGSISPETRSRVGDFMLISRGEGVIKYVSHGVGREPSVVSYHSGLTPEEMRIPLVIV